jgi:hypothetical protein
MSPRRLYTVSIRYRPLHGVGRRAGRHLAYKTPARYSNKPSGEVLLELI